MKHYIPYILMPIVLIYSIFSFVDNKAKNEEPIIEEPIIDIQEQNQEIPDDTNIEEENIIDINIEVNQDGECIYDPGTNFGYRYGPSMLINDDGSIDAFFARPGNNGSMWDYICYRHMDVDGNWSSEEIVLYPTAGSKDSYSVCDPGAIYFDGYYYIGYTGTNSSDGLRNQIFVARSTSVNGPYEKWNGSSWGGNPEPIISYDGEYWGVGEISFVLQDGENKMFCYYSYKDLNEDSMRCSKIDLEENWPSTIRFKQISFHKEAEECSSDVVYYKDKGVYLAFSIGKRMTDKCRLLVHYSLDGKNFEYLDKYKDVIMPNAHNMGISKHLDGHIESNDNLYIAYAYSDDNKWGRWKTNMQEIDID